MRSARSVDISSSAETVCNKVPYSFTSFKTAWAGEHAVLSLIIALGVPNRKKPSEIRKETTTSAVAFSVALTIGQPVKCSMQINKNRFQHLVTEKAPEKSKEKTSKRPF